MTTNAPSSPIRLRRPGCDPSAITTSKDGGNGRGWYVAARIDRALLNWLRRTPVIPLSTLRFPFVLGTPVPVRFARRTGRALCYGLPEALLGFALLFLLDRGSEQAFEKT